MASDDILRNGVRANLDAWIKKLECGGNVEKQIFFKKKFLQRLKNSPVAIETEKANEQHYEVPTEFYLNVLGKRLKYSCCYWPPGIETLEEAEDASLQMYCDRAGIQDGHTVMDLGCGWGSLALYVCEKFPKCRVIAVSNSNTQRQFIQQQGEKLGYSGRLDCVTADANVFTTSKRYDRILSIEMFEHMKNYDTLMQRVSTWLKPSGKLFIQYFSHRIHPYAFDTKPGSDTEWMAKNFFTGGTMPSMDLFLYFQNDLKVEDFWILNGKHYSRTLEYWLSTLDKNKVKVMDTLRKSYGDDADQQMFNWRLFFIFCSEVFGYKDGNEWPTSQLLFKKQARSSL